MYSGKDTSPDYIEFSKNQTRIGRFVWFQKSYKGKIYFEPCFQLLKVNDLGQFEKSQQVYLCEKEEAISEIRNTVIHDAENLGLVPITYSQFESERSRKKSVAKKRLLRKKFKRHDLYSNQKLASTQTIGSAFLERVRKVQNLKNEHKLLK